MDVKLEDGIPKGFRPMDIGPQTTAILRVRCGLSFALFAVSSAVSEVTVFV